MTVGTGSNTMRMATGETREECERAAAEFLDSLDANRLAAVYAPKR